MNSNLTKIYSTIIVGHICTTLPALFLCFGVPAIVFNYLENPWLQLLSLIVFWLIGIISSWFLWSLFIPKWRIWAFKYVDEEDWYVLLEKAVEYKLIWEPGNIAESTEIRNKKDKEIIEKTYERIGELAQVEEIKMDLATPFKTGYKLSLFQNFSEAIAISIIITAIIGLFFTKFYFLGIILLAFILKDIHSLKFVAYSFIPKDYLVLTFRGIQAGFNSKDFIKWENIVSIHIDKNSRKLEFELDDDSKVLIELWRLNIKNIREFEKTFFVYLQRFKDFINEE